jgi:hypothetical protein
MESCIHISMSLVSVSGWVVGVSFLTYAMDWYSLKKTVNLCILLYSVLLYDSCYIYTLMICIDFTVFMCQNSYKFINMVGYTKHLDWTVVTLEDEELLIGIKCSQWSAACDYRPFPNRPTDNSITHNTTIIYILTLF